MPIEEKPLKPLSNVNLHCQTTTLNGITSGNMAAGKTNATLCQMVSTIPMQMCVCVCKNGFTYRLIENGNIHIHYNVQRKVCERNTKIEYSARTDKQTNMLTITISIYIFIPYNTICVWRIISLFGPKTM